MSSGLKLMRMLKNLARRAYGWHRFKMPLLSLAGPYFMAGVRVCYFADNSIARAK